MPEFVKVIETADVPEGSAKCVEVNGHQIGLFNVAGTVYAVDDTCTHAEASLCEGEIVGEEVACPLHFATFCLKTGEATSPPADEPLRTYPVRIVDGAIEIEL